MATHTSGNPLDLIYTRHCSTDHVLVTPLHTSDHFLLSLNLNMIPDTTHTPPHVIFRHNLRSLSPSRLSAMGSSSLPPPKQLASLDANSGCIYMHVLETIMLNKPKKCKTNKMCTTNKMCNTVYWDLINSNMNRDVQEECANRLYWVCTHSNNKDWWEYECFTVNKWVL